MGKFLDLPSTLSEKNNIAYQLPFTNRILEQQQLINNLLEREVINWISGEKGVGKTAFVERVLQHQNFEDYIKIKVIGHPSQFALWIHVAEAIITQVITYEEKKLTQWKRQIKSLANEDLEVLLILVPSLGSLIELEATKSHLETYQYFRFSKIFTEFFRYSLKQPTILFLDDLHKADRHSLEYLAWMLQEEELENVIIIAVYELGKLVIRQANVGPTIQLNPFSSVELRTFLEPLFHADVQDEVALTSFVWDKTKGNIAEVVRLISRWHNEGTVVFHEETRKWKWAVDSVTKLKDLENLIQVDLFDENIISSPINYVLSVATLFKQYFTVDLLAPLVNLEKVEVQSILVEAQSKNLIKQHCTVGEKGYCFINEQVKNHILKQLPHHKQYHYHFDISFLIEEARKHNKDFTIFDVLYHANQVPFLFETVENKEVLAKWNLQGAKVKKQQFEMEEVRTYLQNATSILPFDLSQFSYAIVSQVYVEWAENLQYFGAIKESKHIFNQLIQCAKKDIEKAELYLPIIQMEADSENEVEMLAILDDIARLVQYKLPKNLSKSQQLYRWTKMHLKMKSALERQHFSRLPSMDNRLKIMMKALNVVASRSYKKSEPEWLMWVLLMNEITYKHGIVEESSHSFSGYAFILNFILHDYRAAYKWGYFALNIVEKNTALYKHSKTLLAICNDSWRKFEPKFLDVSIEDISQRQQDKDPWFTKLHLLAKCSLLFQHSYPLQDIQLQLLDESKGLIVSEDDAAWKQATVLTKMISNLTGKVAASDPFISTNIKSPTFLSGLNEKESRFIQEFIYMHDYITGYLLGNFKEAWEAINNCYILINHDEPKIMVDSSRTYYFLLLLKEVFPNLNEAEKKSI